MSRPVLQEAIGEIPLVYLPNNGFVLYYKSLSEEKFHWPSTDEPLLTINGEQLNWLLDGYNIALMKPHKSVRYESVC